MPRDIKDMNMNAGYNQCDARMKILKNETVQKDLDYSEIKKSDINEKSFVYVDNNGKPSKIKLAAIADPNEGVQSDWDEEDELSLAYILNKPNFTLKEDIVSNFNVGGIKIGTVLEAGSSALDILVKMLTSSEQVIFKFDSLVNIDRIRPTEMPDLPVKNVSDILVEGLLIEDVELHNEYYVLLVPRDSKLEVKEVYQGGFNISFKKKEIANYDMYYQGTPSTGTYTFKYKFAKKETD